jgi:hypothetical protein
MRQMSYKKEITLAAAACSAPDQARSSSIPSVVAQAVRQYLL